MATGKVTTTINLRWTLNNSSIQGQAQEVVEQTGEAAIENVQFIGTTSEQLDFGDVTDPGWLLFKNFDPPTTLEPGVKIYLGTTDPVTPTNAQMVIEPGRSNYITPAPGTSATWFGIAEKLLKNGDAPKLVVIAIQR